MAVEMAGSRPSSVTEPVVVSPVYAIEVGGGGSDRLVRELYRLGCTVVDQRIPGYLVVPLRPSLQTAVKHLRGVARMFPAAGTEFERPVTMPAAAPSIQVGAMVRVMSGHYRNLSGVIQSTTDRTLQLEIVLFGRLMTISLPVDAVEPIPLPEAWRG